MKRFKRMIKALFIGAFVGACLTSIDGALLGAFIAEPARTGRTIEGALLWAYYFGLAGAIVGGLVGGAGALLFERLVLRPPSENDR